MRGIVLVIAIVGVLGWALAYPFAGVVLWVWFALQQPHQEAYSALSGSLPLNLIIAIGTGVAWVLSSERKIPPMHPLILFSIALVAWTTLTTVSAFSVDQSFPVWDRTWKTFVLGIVVATLATSRPRIEAIVWISVIALGYYGVKGGLFTIITGGSNHVLGPDNTVIGDNNQLAVALAMSLPLMNYLRIHTANTWLSRGLAVAMVVTLIAVLGTYSRGALIALGALSVAILFQLKRHRLRYFVLTMGTIAIGLMLMPEAYWQRMGTIQNAGDDASFQGRLMAWQVALRYATDHFPLGAGFYGPELPGIFNHYFPGAITHAAHSIYFQVLGEHGFIGLAIYLFGLISSFVACRLVIRRSSYHPELAWAGDLASMIRLSLVAFCVGGAALSMAYYDLFVVSISLLPPLVALGSKQVPRAKVRPPIQPAVPIGT